MKNANTGLMIVAHSPLGAALKECAKHVLPEEGAKIAVLDIVSDADCCAMRIEMERLIRAANWQSVLVLTDTVGASPCNSVLGAMAGVELAFVSGVNLPMLLRVLNYGDETLEKLAQLAVDGGKRGILQL